MQLLNLGPYPQIWDENRKSRLIMATIKMCKDIIRDINSGAISHTITPNLQCVCLSLFNDRDPYYLHVLMYGCSDEQARLIVEIYNTWKPSSWGNYIRGPFFTTEEIMRNVDVVCGPVTELYTRRTWNFHGVV